jgi:hypothetical protein
MTFKQIDTSPSSTSFVEKMFGHRLGFSLFVFSITAFTVVAPFFFLGIPSGHDFEFHMNSWMEVRNQWKQGIVYPRWAEFAHYGFGEARFIFYPPASWMLGAALGSVLPWNAVPGAFTWIALTLSGFSMFFLAQRWLNHKDALLAGALYLANPYYLVIVYWRSAYAELLAGALLPLLLLFILRLNEERWRGASKLGLVVAAAWLTNAPSAVMVNYSLALLVPVLAWRKRSSRILLYGVTAVVIGLGMAAFYVLPAAYEEKWVNIAQVLAPGVQPKDNFLFTTLADADHNHFNRLISLVATGEIIWLCIVGAWSWKRRDKELWWPAVIWSAAASLLMFSVTSIAWNHLPKLQFVQLPWRWLLCLNVGLCLLVLLAWQSWWPKLLTYAVMLGILAFVWHRVQNPWWDLTPDIKVLINTVQDKDGYEGTDEYVPVAGDAYEISQTGRDIALDGSGSADIRILHWDAEERRFTATVTEPSHLAVRLFNYPAWRVEVNGRVVTAGTREKTGQVIVPMQAGFNEARITFIRTWDRMAGAVISVLMLLAMALVPVFGQRTKVSSP